MPAADAACTAGSTSSVSKLFGLEDWVELHAGGPAIPSDDDAEAERLVRSTVLASSDSWEAQVRECLAVYGDKRGACRKWHGMLLVHKQLPCAVVGRT